MADQRSSVLDKLRRQTGVFFDDIEIDGEETDVTEDGLANGPDDATNGT